MYLLPLSFLAIRVSVTIILSGHSCIRYHYPFWLLMYSLPLSFLSVHVSVTIILSVHWCIHYHYPFCSLMYPLPLSSLVNDFFFSLRLSSCHYLNCVPAVICLYSRSVILQTY
jgi:hypothetical protein